jgi:hypothetical protein
MLSMYFDGCFKMRHVESKCYGLETGTMCVVPARATCQNRRTRFKLLGVIAVLYHTRKMPSACHGELKDAIYTSGTQ